MTTIAFNNPVSYLRNEYQRQQALFSAQPTMIQRFVESQAQHLAEAITTNARQVRFSFPDRVVAQTPQTHEMAAMLVPAEVREQTLGGWGRRLNGHNLLDLTRQFLSELEQSPDRAVSASADLLRHAIALHMVYVMLPAGRSVTYQAEGVDEIPTIPVASTREVESALTLAGDAIAEEHPDEKSRGEFQVPFVPAARRFYLPQWVSFDENGTLLANSISEAEAHLAAMERFVTILHTASSLAPYILADETYQHKRYGMLGQVINQGRALAGYKTRQIIQKIKERAQNGSLNRGLSISLPYYNDQDLRMSQVEMEAIPAGRIMFKPIFVVRAARLEHAKVTQDTRLNASTRKYLLHEMEMLEQAFTNFTDYK